MWGIFSNFLYCSRVGIWYLFPFPPSFSLVPQNFLIGPLIAVGPGGVQVTWVWVSFGRRKGKKKISLVKQYGTCTCEKKALLLVNHLSSLALNFTTSDCCYYYGIIQQQARTISVRFVILLIIRFLTFFCQMALVWRRRVLDKDGRGNKRENINHTSSGSTGGAMASDFYVSKLSHSPHFVIFSFETISDLNLNFISIIWSQSILGWHTLCFGWLRFFFSIDGNSSSSYNNTTTIIMAHPSHYVMMTKKKKAKKGAFYFFLLSQSGLTVERTVHVGIKQAAVTHKMVIV